MKKLLSMIAVMYLALFSLPSNAGLLYKIEGKNLQAPSYLFGTIHIICQRDFWLPKEVQEAWDNTEQTVMELDITSPDVTHALQQGALQQPSDYLAQHLTPEQLAVLDQYVREHTGMQLVQVAAVKPMILSSLLIPSYLNCAQQGSYEGYFAQQAVMTERKVLGLETASYQLGIFDQIPLDEQVAWLYDMVDKPEQTKQQLQEMITSYLANDTEALFQLISEQQEFAAYKDLLLANRNINWAEKLPEIINQQATFVAVGAGHLGGEQGLVKLLRKKGYQVTEISLTK